MGVLLVLADGGAATCFVKPCTMQQYHIHTTGHANPILAKAEVLYGQQPLYYGRSHVDNSVGGGLGRDFGRASDLSAPAFKHSFSSSFASPTPAPFYAPVPAPSPPSPPTAPSKGPWVTRLENEEKNDDLRYRGRRIPLP